jgi:hypothetical protein
MRERAAWPGGVMPRCVAVSRASRAKQSNTRLLTKDRLIRVLDAPILSTRRTCGDANQRARSADTNLRRRVEIIGLNGGKGRKGGVSQKNRAPDRAEHARAPGCPSWRIAPEAPTSGFSAYPRLRVDGRKVNSKPRHFPAVKPGRGTPRPRPRARKRFRFSRTVPPRERLGRRRQSKPFFLRISSALFLSTSMVGSVMTGGIFSPFRSLTAWRRPSAPGVA